MASFYRLQHESLTTAVALYFDMLQVF